MTAAGRIRESPQDMQWCTLVYLYTMQHLLAWTNQPGLNA
jgi:hypothetical protein